MDVYHESLHSHSLTPRRVFAIHIGPRYIGCVILEEYGLVHRGFRTISLRGRGTDREKGKYLVRRMGQFLRRHQVDVISVGQSQHPLAKPCREIHQEIRKFIRKNHLPFESHTSREIRLLFLDRSRQKKRDHLAKNLTHGFVPALLREICPTGNRERYRRTAWLALGLAILVFMNKFPLSMIILARIGAYKIRRFSELLCERIRALD